MLRKLSAIEIAEGALLADIAVIFQLLVIYLPVGDTFFRLLIPIVFAVLVLRRGLYPGIMALCVALFIVGLMTGLQFLVLMLLECGAGLFLGFTMKYRLRHFILIFAGVTGSALLVYGLLILSTLLTGFPLSRLVLELQKSYETAISLVNVIAANVGLGTWWRHSIYPTVGSLAKWGFTYWWALLLVALWVVLWPVVTVVYFTTNLFVRLLGYQVRPFPDGRPGRLLRRMARFIVRRVLRSEIGKRWIGRSAVKESLDKEKISGGTEPEHEHISSH